MCRRQKLSPAPFYKLKVKYDGMDVLDAEAEALEGESATFKRLLADNDVLKDRLGRN